jgi:hypothetical protein
MFRRIVSGVTLGAAVCAVLGLVDGCLTRPVAATNPVTKTNFITSIPQGSIDKVDLLFDIDNSASMGDKQEYLSEAVPDLIKRLVQPNCLDAMGNIMGTAMADGTCPGVTTAEFPPVHNLHIGIVSSSLGARLGDVCPTTGESAAQPLDSTVSCTGPNQPTTQCLDRHNDDQAHLLNRGGTLANFQETGVTDAPSPDNFLNWFPPVTANQAATPTGPKPVTDSTTLQSDFQTMVIGVHQFGCGIESQLETWYRFLIQPDPYASLTTDSSGRAQWVGIDTTLLAQRADFLRPDSLVAILVLTDENDSEVDVRSFGGSAWQFMKSTFQPPRGTADCATNPGASTCTSCYSSTAGVCATRYSSVTDWGFDLNLRHVHEKQKYGASVQFPIQRYVVGLTSPKVPNRDGEYPPASANQAEGTGAYASSYQGLVTANQTCVNPLYAASLPKPPTTSTTWTKDLAASLCNLSVGPRKPNLVFYAHIGGVPHQLLQNDPSKTDVTSQSQKDTLSDADWQLILGNDPENFDYSGIDPHMVESYKSRVSDPSNVNLPTGGFKVSAGATGVDPIAGKEWTTDSTMPLHTSLRVDREYACIFKLATPRDCSNTATTADPTLQDSCDCQPPAMGTFTQDQVPAVCNDSDPSKYTEQDSAKAYPTIRELELAHLLGKVPGANEGIISSLCPIDTADNATGDDPLYGYRPAMNAIISRLKQALSHTCLPQQLEVDDSTGTPLVQCLVLVTFPKNSPPQGNCEDPSLNGAYQITDPTVLQHFNNDQHAQWVAAGMPGDDPSKLTTCTLKQLAARKDCSAKSATGSLGWCYVDQGMVQGCPQAILFAPGAVTGASTTSLQCIEASANPLSDGGSPLGTISTPDDAAASGD